MGGLILGGGDYSELGETRKGYTNLLCGIEKKKEHRQTMPAGNSDRTQYYIMRVFVLW